MPEYAGSALALTFVNAAGTLNMAPETRDFKLTPSQSVIDTTAGQDANMQSIPSFVTYAPAWSGVAQDGTSGTAYAQQLKAGTSGTLIYGPSGTATGSVKYTIPAFSMGLATDSPYAGVTTYDCTFSVSSGGSVTVGVY